MKDYYQALGLLPNVDEVVIKAAYKALAQKYHPDKHPGEKAEYNKIMSELNEAYAVIGFKHKRKDYDLKWAKAQAKGKPKKSSSEKSTDAEETHSSHKKDHQAHGRNHEDSSSTENEHHHKSHHKAKNTEFDSILKQLHENQMDEYQLINLFEKTFSLKVEISSGYINNYCYTKDDKMHVVNFEKIKLELINHLTK